MNRRHVLAMLALAPVAASLPGCSSGDRVSTTELPPLTVGDRAFAFGRDGTVIEIKATEGVIEQLPNGTTPGWRYGGDLQPDGRPVQPTGVLVTSNGCLVSEPGRARVTMLDRRGIVVGLLEPDAPAGARRLVNPAGGPDGRAWFIDQTGRRLESFSEDGRAAGGFGLPAGVGLPHALAIDPAGRLHLLDASGQVAIVDPAGKLVGRYGEPGGGPGQMLRPHDIEIDADGTVTLSDAHMAALHHFDSDGRPIASRRVPYAGSAFGIPRALARRPDGGTYVQVAPDLTRGAAHAHFVHLS